MARHDRRMTRRQRASSLAKSKRTQSVRMVELQGLHPLKHALRFGARVERAAAPEPERVVALARELAPDVADAIAALLEHGPAGDFDVVAWAERPARRPLGAG